MMASSFKRMMAVKLGIMSTSGITAATEGGDQVSIPNLEYYSALKSAEFK